MQPTTRKPRQDGTRAPIQPFDANEALLLIRMLAYNLVRRWIQVIRSWRMSWMREAYILIPGDFVAPEVWSRSASRLAPPAKNCEHL